MLKGAWTKHAKSAKMTEDALRFSKMFVRAPCRTSDKREVPVENRLHGTHVCKCVCVWTFSIEVKLVPVGSWFWLNC